MKQVGAYEAKTHFSRLIQDVQNGQSFTITRNGVPVAKLVPAEQDRKRAITEVIGELREFRENHSLGGITIRELIEEGRRF